MSQAITHRIVIRKVWNTPRDRAIADELLTDDVKVWRRGRGPRNNRTEHQSLPHSRAAYLSYYVTFKKDYVTREYTDWKGRTHKDIRLPWDSAIDQVTLDFVGRDQRTGKPRLRLAIAE